MSRSIGITLAVVAVIAVISIGAFFYMTRDIAAPSESVQTNAEQLEVSSSGEAVVFRISQDESQVEYNIYELLNGEDKTVVGTTSEVAGDILVNLTDPTQSEIGELSINARTFATDETHRDNSVARFILQSEDDVNEFITFQPTSIGGLPDSIEEGDSVKFQVTGDLTIAETTSEVAFTVTATLESADRLVGHAETVTSRATFNLTIPNVPFVANVGDEVTLKIDFVANAVTTTVS